MIGDLISEIFKMIKNIFHYTYKGTIFTFELITAFLVLILSGLSP
jgi:hypothetical protein